MQNYKLRIAMLIDCYGGNFIGGGQVHVQNLKRKLEKNHNCHIEIFSQKNPNIVTRLLFNVWIVPAIALKHLKNPFNVIHAHAYSAGLSGKILSLILNTPIVYTIHGSNTLDLVKSKIECPNWKYYLEKWFLTGIVYDAQISVASNFLNYKNVNKNIYIISNGVEIISELKYLTKNKLDKKVLLFVGRLEKIKGLDKLIKALSEIKNDFELRIVGEGGQINELKKLVSDKNISNKIKFLGKKTKQELQKEYQKADLFVLPSLSEGQPLTLLEAWANKIPVLVTRVGDNINMVENAIDGFLAEFAKQKHLRETLQYAFKNINKWKEMGIKGYKKAAKKYTWDETARKTYLVYKKVLKIKK
jgi:glycosyltransferase involved in cell wall biosynthesis